MLTHAGGQVFPRKDLSRCALDVRQARQRVITSWPDHISGDFLHNPGEYGTRMAPRHLAESVDFGRGGPGECATHLRMAAYFIAQYVVHNPELYKEYQASAGPTISASGGELIVFDVAAESIEGNPPGPQTVILKFEDVQAAKAWYNSADYQAVVGKRLESTDGFAVISESMNFG